MRNRSVYHRRPNGGRVAVFALLGLSLTLTPPAEASSHWICLDGNYLNTSCWDDGIPSDPGEVGVIDEDNFGNPYTVTFNGTGGAGSISLAVPEARWYMANSSFNPAFSFNVVPGAEVEMLSSSFDGGTGVYTNGGTLTTRRTCLIDLAGFEQNNLLRIVANGIGGNAELTVTPSFTNHGVMEFQGSCCAGNNAVLIVPGSEMLTNTGAINLLAGPGNHIIDANLDNPGTINLGKTSFFNKLAGAYTTSGAINFGESVVLNIDNTASFAQTAGLIDMPASSRIDVDTGGAYDFAGGTLSGQARLTNADLSLAPASSGGAFEFRGPDSTLTGDIGADQSITLFAPGNGLPATVTTTGDLTSSGIVRFSSQCCSAANTTLALPDGNLFTNLGLLDLSAAAGTQTLSGNVDNQGTVTMMRNTVFNRSGTTFSNAGDITITSPGVLNLSNATTFSQEAGTLDIGSGTVTALAAGCSFLFQGGDILGLVRLTDAALEIGTGSNGTGSFEVRSNANTLAGDIAAAQTITLFSPGNGPSAALTTTGNITNNGTIRTTAGCCNGSDTSLLVPDGSVLTNTGLLDLSQAAGRSLVTADLDNFGTVSITTTATFDKPGGLFRNAGNVTVADPGSINTRNGASFAQDAGTLNLQDEDADAFLGTGSSFFYNGGAISGAGDVVLTSGNLVIDPNATGPGRFRFLLTGNTLTGNIAADQSVAVQATGFAGQSAAVTTTGDLVNAGSLSFEGGCCSGNSASLIVPDGSLLTNTGSIVLLGNDGFRRLTADLDNQGSIVVDRRSAFDKPAGVYTNRGALTIQSGNRLDVSGDSFSNIAGGMISGQGTLDVSGVSFSNQAVVAPGLSIGTLTVTGTFTQTIDGILQIEVAGTTPGAEHDRLAVNGTGVVNLDGTLDVVIQEGFNPQPSDSFTIVTGSSINGDFANAPRGPGDIGTLTTGAGTFDVLYQANAVLLGNFVAAPACPGDVDGDAAVGLSDLALVLANFGTTSGATLASGDLDGDGDVDLSDLAALLGAFGTVCP